MRLAIIVSGRCAVQHPQLCQTWNLIHTPHCVNPTGGSGSACCFQSIGDELIQRLAQTLGLAVQLAMEVRG